MWSKAIRTRSQPWEHFSSGRAKKVSYNAHPAFADDEAYENFITLLRATATKRMAAEEIEAAALKAKALAADDKSYVAMMTRAFGLSHGAWLKANERRHQLRQVWDAFL